MSNEDQSIEGSFASVYKGHMFDNKNELIAIKIIDKKKFQNKKNRKNFIQDYINREKVNQQQLQSPNVVKMIDVIEDDDNCCFILEFCEGGNLQKKLEKGALPQEEALQIFKQVVNGYKELRDKNIIHRDLKPENILFSKKIAKIGDFGFSKFLDDLDQTILQSGVGTPYYAAPEIRTGHFSSKADIWSLGLIFYYMIYGSLPVEILKQVNYKEQKIDVLECPENKKIPGDIIDLLKKMLVVNPDKRMFWDELFAENLLHLIIPQNNEILDQISEQKAIIMKQTLQNENKVENIYQYFIYILDILQFIRQIIIDVQILRDAVMFSREQQLSFLIITIKYMVNELKFYQGILKGQSLFSIQILPSDFELFKKSDKYYSILQNYKKNYENQKQFYNQTKEKFDKFLISEQKNENQNKFNNIIEALEQDENNQKFCQTYNEIYSQILMHILSHYKNKPITQEENSKLFKMLIRLLHCFQPLQLSHHIFDPFKIEEKLLTSSGLEKEFKDLYEKLFNK
ncbi:unnamed protein product [Paramecium pentaurelia]|uniref:Protein kinase domain-containing protein n=1 Tax=Paramecium pentaurelia TaxID=43138 RepID=A0A8S1XRF1_9CILI|nr:unnamed protein product [Paramecium pentaurelia]